MVDRGGAVDYTCSCRLGFSGPLCLTPRDNPCLANPCRNGGTCDLLTLTDYKCLCPPGWSGEGAVGRALWTPVGALGRPAGGLALALALPWLGDVLAGAWSLGSPGPLGSVT